MEDTLPGFILWIRTGFFFRRIGEAEFRPIPEREVSQAFLGICEIHTGKAAGPNTVTDYLKKFPGRIRGAVGGDYVYLQESE